MVRTLLEAPSLDRYGVDAVRVLPIDRALSAGFPAPAHDFLKGTNELPRRLVPNPPATFPRRAFCWAVVGVSIHDGDIVLADRSSSGRWICLPGLQSAHSKPPKRPIEWM